MTYPNFAVIGTAKSGTTSLHYYLDQHPQVYMSPQKETNFFAFEGDEDWFRGPEDERDLETAVITNLEDYERQFEGARDEVAVGESSTWYLYSTQAARKMHALLPRAKLIALLRNPADRAFSSYLHLVREGREPLSFEEALRAEEERISNRWAFMWHYRRAGFYAVQVKRFLDLFGREQLRFYLYEDLADPDSLLEDIYRFLEVEAGFLPDTSVRHQATGVPRSRLLGRLLFEPNPLKATAKRFLPVRFRRDLREQVGRRLLSRPTMSRETREELLSGYEQDIRALQALIGRDLSAWLA